MGEALRYPFMQNALVAVVLASVACGIIGTYVVVKRIAFLSGGISHTAYGGVGLGYLLGIPPLLGATSISLLAALFIGLASLRLHQAADTAIGIIWAVGMALGIIFVGLAPGPVPDLMSYLFGNVLLVGRSDLVLMAALLLIVLAVVGLLYKELFAVTYDEEYAKAMGIPAERIFLLLLMLIALTVIVLIRVVGIILVIALFTIPPATARLFVNRLSSMMVTSTLIGIVSTVCGLFLSFALNVIYQKPFPSGPVIILLSAVIYLLSLVARRLFRFGS